MGSDLLLEKLVSCLSLFSQVTIFLNEEQVNISHYQKSKFL